MRALTSREAVQAIPSERFTWRTPATMFANFRLEAHRAVWLKPQSGANTKRSAGDLHGVSGRVARVGKKVTYYTHLVF